MAKKKYRNKPKQTVAAPVATPAKSNNRKYIYLALAIIAITIICYLPALKAGFTNWDDDVYVTNNNLVKNFSTQYLPHLFSFYKLGDFYPLNTLSYAIDYKIWGMNAKGFHLTNLLFHLLNVLLVFWLMLRLIKRKDIALAAALVFAVHPVNVESVAWVSGRKEVLFTFFYLGALISYLYYITNNYRLKYLILSLLLFFFSLLSKIVAVTLPGIILLIDYYYSRKFNLKWLWEKIPFVLLSVFFLFVGYLLTTHLGSVNLKEQFYSIFERIFLVSYCSMFYIVKFLFPVNLTAIYPFPPTGGHALPWEYYASLVAVAAIIFAIIKLKNHRKNLVFGLLFYIVAASTVIQIVPAHGQSIVWEHYAYLPFIGLIFILGKVYSQLMDTTAASSIKKLKPYFIGLAAIFLLAFSITTYSRNQVWKDSKTLWSDAVKKMPEAEAAWYNLGSIKNNSLDYTGALEAYDNAIRINPTYSDAYASRGMTKINLGKFKEGLADCDISIKLNPSYAYSYLCEGIGYADLNILDSALKRFNKAIDLKKDYNEALSGRGVVKARLGDDPGAMQDFDRAIAIDPGFADVYSNRGIAKAIKNKLKESLADFNTAVNLKPDFAAAWTNRAKVYLALGQKDAACSDFYRAQSLGSAEASYEIQKTCK